MNPSRQALLKRAEELDVSNIELHRASGVSRAIISRYFTGKADITSETYDRLSAALDLYEPKPERSRDAD